MEQHYRRRRRLRSRARRIPGSSSHRCHCVCNIKAELKQTSDNNRFKEWLVAPRKLLIYLAPMLFRPFPLFNIRAMHELSILSDLSLQCSNRISCGPYGPLWLTEIPLGVAITAASLQNEFINSNIIRLYTIFRNVHFRNLRVTPFEF